jgi:RNA polymerase sigma-70 factor (family 1)
LPEQVSHNEKDLLLQVATGDEAAFRQLYTLYEKLLIPYLIELTKSDFIAEDLVQETMLRVWLNRENINTLEYPRAYIYRIAGNCAYSWLKSRLIRKQAEQEKASLEPNAISEAEAESDLSFQSITAIVKQAIRNMPAQRSRIYYMSREQGMKPAEIARVLNISISTVNNTLYQAVRTIREEVEKAGYLLPYLILFFSKFFLFQ